MTEPLAAVDSRFVHPCTGIGDPARWGLPDDWRCGELHHCVAHAKVFDGAGVHVGWRRCDKRPRVGQAVCHSHGGAAPHNERRAADLLAASRERAVMVLTTALESDDERVAIGVAKYLEGRTKDMDPGSALDRLVAEIRRDPTLLTQLLDAVEADPQLLRQVDG